MASNANETQKVFDTIGKTVANINPQYIDDMKTSLHLFGDNLSELSRALNENFIRVTQDFYGDNPPIAPFVGQKWLNKKDNITYKWMGSNWVQTGMDVAYDSFMYVKYDLGDTKEFVLDQMVFNFNIKNIKIYDQDFNNVRFIIDPFDAKKIILKDNNITSAYILVFHPYDRITNPIINKRVEIFAESGQTQYVIDTFVDGTNINTLSVALNGTMLKNNEFVINNDVLSIDGRIYRVKKNDVLTIWSYGGSLTGYFSDFKVTTSGRASSLKIPKFFKNIVSMEIIDTDEKVTINPIEVIDYDDYLDFQFLDKKNVIANLHVRII